MQIRFRTFGEFQKQIKIETAGNGGATRISCRNIVLFYQPFQPWNSEATKVRFLVRVYIDQVLHKANPSRLIPRIPAFYLLGKRSMHNDRLAVICNVQDVLNTETGESTKQLTISNSPNTKPYKVLITEVQL